MSHSDQAPDVHPPASDEELPPVEPPSAGFFVQLFLLPALLVVGIMTVWFLFGKLAGADQSIEDYVAIIKSDRKDRWKAADDLARLLRANSPYVKSEPLAVALATELQATLDESSAPDPQLMEYLAGALGNMETSTGVPALRRATAPEHPPAVRRVALIALARLAHRLDGRLEDPNVVHDVREHLSDDDPELRELAAFALGFLGDRRAVPALVGSLDDAERTVRYNAAIALGSLDSAAGLPTIAEMLDQEELSSHFHVDMPGTERIIDEPLVFATMIGGLRSLKSLHATSPEADFSPVLESLEALAGNENAVVRSEANELLRNLRTPVTPNNSERTTP